MERREEQAEEQGITKEEIAAMRYGVSGNSVCMRATGLCKMPRYNHLTLHIVSHCNKRILKCCVLNKDNTELIMNITNTLLRFMLISLISVLIKCKKKNHFMTIVT